VTFSGTASSQSNGAIVSAHLDLLPNNYPFRSVGLTGTTAPYFFSFQASIGEYLQFTLDDDASNTYGDGEINISYQITPANKPSVTPTSLTWDTSQGGGGDFGYQVSNALTQATQVGLYWSSTNQFAGAIAPVPGTTITIPVGTAQGSYGPFNEPAVLFGQPPPMTKYLLVVTDPNNVLGNFDPTKNVKALAVPDLVADSLYWHTTEAPVGTSFTPDQGGGVDFTYHIDNSDLPAPATISFYWVQGPSFNRNNTASPTYKLAYQTQSQTTANASILLHVSADRLQNIPSGANGANNDLTLFAVVDAPVPGNVNGNVIESDQTNDVEDLSADPESIVGPVITPRNGRVRSVEALESGPRIDATFRPAGGALTLAQAATIVGVDHFNWVQTITAVPNHWTWVRSGPNQTVVVFFAGGFNYTTLYDPDIGSPGVSEVRTSPFGQFEPIITQDPPDNYVYYFNDLDAVNSETAGHRLQDYTTTFQLEFNDTPEFTVGDYNSGESMSFLTQLAGVRAGFPAGITPVVWNGVQSNFTWKSDAVKLAGGTGGGITFGDYTKTFGNDPGLPPIVAGGVFDLQYNDQILATTTSVASDHSSGSTYGQSVTFSAMVSAAGSTTGTPTGSVQFDIDGNPVGSPIALVNGNASLSMATLSAGTHKVTAFYMSNSGNFNNSDNSTTPFTQTVSRALLTVTGDDQTRVYDQANPPLTFHLSGFVNGDTASVLAGAPSLATPATATSPIGPYPITVAPGNLTAANYTFAFVNGTLHIDPAATGTALGASLLTPLAGVDTVALTASVTVIPPGAGSPSGSVDFFDTTTGIDLGHAPLSGGTATFNVPPLAAGPHVLRATYSGDGNFLSSSGTLSLTALVPASLSGSVFADFNDDGQINFGESGISGVIVHLTGTDDLGHGVDRALQTGGNGAYLFGNLRPGSYYLTKVTQPSGYTPGIDSVGTAGGSLSTTVADQFFVRLAQGVNGRNYNYGERPAATGPVQQGQTAGIGFWNNSNGQALILAFNGGGTSHQLGDWLAATFVNLYGANSGNNLMGKNNAYVAALFQQDFQQQGPKLDAQVLATALSVYATNATLDSTQAAAAYGFTVSGYGVGTATFNVGSNGDAFGVANNTTMTVMDLLLATDAQTVHGLLYNGNTTRRNEATNVYGSLNQAGGIS
jgi:hypothetical protein